MNSILRATAILSSSSLVTIVVGLVSAKAWAVWLGPSEYGYMGLLQALVGLAGLVAGAGLGTGLIRMGANALARGDSVQVAALHRAIWILFWAMGGLTVSIMVVFRIPISQLMLGGTEHSGNVVLMGIALLFNLAAGLQTSFLNVYHRIEALAAVGTINSVLGAGVGIIVIWLWREQGVIPAILVGAVTGWLVPSYFVRRKIDPLPTVPNRRDVIKAARSILRFSGPYTASMLVGTGVQFALPALVLHSMSAESVGFYRAASSIAGVYLGFLLAAMGQDYYPRISAVSDQPTALVRLVNQQHRLVMLLAVPMILGTLAIAPFLVPLIYSAQFTPAVEILEWQLIGDLFKFSSWTMGFVILARSSGATVFLVELIAGVNLLATTWFGIHWFGLVGLGIGFLITYVIHYLITLLIVRRSIGLVWTLDNRLMFIGAVLAMALIRGLSLTGLELLRTPAALTLAALACVGSLYAIWHQVSGIRYLRLWDK